MLKGLRSVIVIIAVILLSSALYGQENNYSTAYNPTKLAKRLSYENFRDLKLLQSAIYNFGKGSTNDKKKSVDDLIEEYAEASALYFQSRYKESAKLFAKNQQDIFIVAKGITKKYKDSTYDLLMLSTRKTIKGELNRAIKGGKKSRIPDKLLSNARFAFNKATDYYENIKNATTASSKNLIKSIYYYRKSKANMFLLLKVIKMDVKEREKLLSKYKRDIDDSENRVYKGKEKNQ